MRLNKASKILIAIATAILLTTLIDTETKAQLFIHRRIRVPETESYRYQTSQSYISERIAYLQDKAVNYVDNGKMVAYYTRFGKEAFRFENNRMILPPKGKRPEAKKYLTHKTIRNHKKEFRKEGCGIVVIKQWTIDNPTYSTWPPRKFVGLASDMNKLIDQYHQNGNNVMLLNDQLGLGSSYDELSKCEIYYITIKPGDRRFRYGFPSGNEIGAYNDIWMPGGLTILGVKECVLIHAEKVTYKPYDVQSFLANFDSDSWVKLQ